MEDIFQQKIKSICGEIPYTEEIKMDLRKDFATIPGLRNQLLKKVQCEKCGWCCRTQKPQINKREFHRLRKFLGINKQEFMNKYTETLNENLDGNIYLHSPCLFLNENNECSVYSVRPNICKEFPIVYPRICVGECHIGKVLEFCNKIITKILLEKKPNCDTLLDDSTIKAFNKIDKEKNKQMNLEESKDKMTYLMYDRNVLNSLLDVVKSMEEFIREENQNK